MVWPEHIKGNILKKYILQHGTNKIGAGLDISSLKFYIESGAREIAQNEAV